MYYLYRDGKDLYITDKKLNDTEYEEKVTHRKDLYFLVMEAMLRIGDGQADYLWVDANHIKEVETFCVDNESVKSKLDIGVFCVNNGEAIELEGGITC